MNKEDAIKYLQQLYPNGGHCWLDEQRIEAISMAVKALQEEPESIWHDANEKPNIKEKGFIFVITSLNGEYIGSRYYNHNDITINFGNYDKWAYLNDLLNLSNVQRTVKDRKEPVSEDLEEAADSYIKTHGEILGFGRQTFKAGAKWQKAKDKSVTNDLGDYINELSKQFPEVSFAKLSRIAVRVAKWQKERLWKPADGDDLPEIDIEVIALLDNGKVVFAHRPDPKGWDAKSVITGKVEHYTPKTYGKGGWNIPDIVYWLDIELPKEIEL